MATNNDLDDFFKKKDRKGHKHKKQTGLLTNNEELLKQLVIVTSATTIFKENPDFDEDEDEYQINNGAIIGSGLVVDEQQFKQPIHHKSKISDEINSKNTNGQSLNLEISSTNTQQQDEWEEFIDDNSKYEQIRSKLARKTNNYNDNDEYYDDHDDNDDNTNANGNEINSTSDLSKDKPVWKTSEIKQSNEPQVEDKVDEPTPVSKPTPAPAPPSSTSAYRPPQLRGSTTGSVTVISGINQRTNKKKEPNLASTDEFPTLGATVSKK